MKIEGKNGSFEVKDHGVDIRTLGSTWPTSVPFTDIRNIEFEPAEEFMDGTLRLADASGKTPGIRFSFPENGAFRAFAAKLDAIYRGRGWPLMPISTGLTIPGYEIVEVVDVITSEAAMGMHIFKDIANAWRDVVGGRSKSIQGILREARESCLWELRQEARRRFADGVIGVDLDYSEFSSSLVSGGMVLVVASGTAVRLKAVE